MIDHILDTEHRYGRYRQAVQEAERRYAIEEALRARPARSRTAPLLLRLGDRLIGWGEWLQARACAPGPAPCGCEPAR
jgi:hypothetical protein